MSGRVTNKIKTLRRRRDWLAARTATYRPEGNPSHDKAELAALEWAIAVIEEARSRGILEELTGSRVFS